MKSTLSSHWSIKSYINTLLIFFMYFQNHIINGQCIIPTQSYTGQFKDCISAWNIPSDCNQITIHVDGEGTADQCECFLIKFTVCRDAIVSFSLTSQEKNI